MNIEIFVAVVSILGAITSLVSAIAAFRRDEIKAKLETRVLEVEEEAKKLDIQSTVADETVGLYRKLSEQYTTITDKDKKLLRTLTYVIRHLIVLDRTVADILSEMEHKLEDHSSESESIDCPFYDTMNAYMMIRVRNIESLVRETLDEVDKLMFNGTGPVIRPRPKEHGKIVDNE